MTTAPEIREPRSTTVTGRIDPSYKRSGGPKGSFEMAGWLFMRLSGIVLVVLIFGHLTVNLLVGKGVHGIDFGFVAGKWASPFWQFWDLAMLWLAMLHGTNGVRTIINDYAERDSVRFWLKMVLFAAAIVIVILGTLVIFTFDPCPQGVTTGLPDFCPAA